MIELLEIESFSLCSFLYYVQSLLPKGVLMIIFEATHISQVLFKPTFDVDNQNRVGSIIVFVTAQQQLQPQQQNNHNCSWVEIK